MKYAIKIHKISTVNTLPDAWNISDYKQLLEKFGFADAQGNDGEELKELLLWQMEQEWKELNQKYFLLFLD